VPIVLIRGRLFFGNLSCFTVGLSHETFLATTKDTPYQQAIYSSAALRAWLL